MKRGLGFVVLGISAILGFTGCGGGGGGGGGDGRGRPAPPEMNCEDYCERTKQCIVELCEEDVGRPVPAVLLDLLDTQCPKVCSEQLLMTGLDQAKWECLFENSCRQILADDICQVSATYACNY